MTMPPKDDDDGNSPPAKSKRKRSRRKKAKGKENDGQMLDRLLRTPVSVTLSGEKQRVPAIVAIVCQLQSQEITGDPRASKLLLDLRKLTRKPEDKKLQIVFVESKNAGSRSIKPAEDELG